jgi:hypothetical protein
MTLPKMRIASSPLPCSTHDFRHPRRAIGTLMVVSCAALPVAMLQTISPPAWPLQKWLVPSCSYPAWMIKFNPS